MTIIAFTGTPGSGKTYDAVRKILDNLQLGRTIYTNIDGINEPRCLEMIKIVCGLSDLALAKQLHFFEDDQLSDFWNHVAPKSMIVLDEVQNIFNAREWQTDKNKHFGAWCSIHRHLGFELILITQDVARIDSSVRSLLEWTYVYRKVNFFGSMVQQKYMQYSYAGDDTRSPLKKTIRTYEKLVFLCYKSYVADDIKEQGIMQHVNVLKHPVFYILPLLLCFTLYMFLGKSSFSKGDLFGAQETIKKNAAAAKLLRNKTAPHTTKSNTPELSDTHAPTITQSSTGGRIILSNRIKRNQP